MHLKIIKNCTHHEFQIRKYPQIQLSKRARVSLLLILHCMAQQLEFPHFQVPEAIWGPHGPLGIKPHKVPCTGDNLGYGQCSIDGYNCSSKVYPTPSTPKFICIPSLQLLYNGGVEEYPLFANLLLITKFQLGYLPLVPQYLYQGPKK